MNRLDSYGQVARFLGVVTDVQKDGDVLQRNRETKKRMSSWNIIKFGHVEFEMPVRHQGGYVQQVFKVATPSPQERIKG